MKRAFIGLISRLSLLVLFTFILFPAAYSQPAEAVPPATISYLGLQEDMIVFNVRYDNPKGGKWILFIKDQDGVLLYQHMFEDRYFYKQFRLPKADKDKIAFIIHNNTDTGIVKAFEINTGSQFIKEVASKKTN